jgi:hypothetical protein
VVVGVYADSGQASQARGKVAAHLGLDALWVVRLQPESGQQAI